jgi:hypothetical protein
LLPDSPPSGGGKVKARRIERQSIAQFAAAPSGVPCARIAAGSDGQSLYSPPVSAGIP